MVQGIKRATLTGGKLARNNNDDEVADLEELDVKDVCLPLVGEVHLSGGEENWLGGLAVNQLLGRLLEEVPDGIPEGVSRGLALRKEEKSGAVGGASSEAVTHGGVAELDILLANAHEQLGHVNKGVAEVNGANKGGGGRVVELEGLLELEISNDAGVLL